MTVCSVVLYVCCQSVLLVVLAGGLSLVHELSSRSFCCRVRMIFIAFVPPYYNTLVDNININIGSSDTNVVSSVTNLGVRLDRNLKITAQTSHLMSFCAYQLKLVNSIRASLDVQVAERVVNTIFASRLDYCNSLLTGLTVQDFTRLQRLQITSARCVLMRPRDFSATDMLCELHWLPVRKRVSLNMLYYLDIALY